MEAELGYCLLTYTCGCAATVPSIASQDEEKSSQGEPFQFGRYRIEKHHGLSEDCDDPFCKGQASLESRKKQIHRMIRQIQSRFRENSIAYIKLGQRYHSCLLRIRMRFSSSEQCALAHEQFAISTTSWRDDPFFRLDEKARNLLHGARIAMQNLDDNEVAKLTMEMVNQALFLSCRKAEAMLSLRVGVNEIVAAEREEFGPATPRGEVKSKKKVTSAELQQSALPLPPKLSCLDIEALNSSTSCCTSLCSPNTPPSPASTCLTPETQDTSASPRRKGRKVMKLPRHPDYTWPMYRWSLYNPRGVVPQDSSPITSRKLNSKAGPRRNTERERLFQKMMYGKWTRRVKGPRCGALGGQDMYAIWPS